MDESYKTAQSGVRTRYCGSLMTVELHRPHQLNSLNLAMVRAAGDALKTARSTDRCKGVLLLGAGERAFCAGGDIKELAQWVRKGEFDLADRFFKEEYALDLLIHQFPKPVVIAADGIAMGGGLGLTAGADVVIATEKTRMAMPETSIGFFPDVGATGWLFSKCPNGYPAYLALTGRELSGKEAVRFGLATHLVDSGKMEALLHDLTSLAVPDEREDALTAIRSQIEPYCTEEIPAKPDLDRWVKDHFEGKASLQAIFSSLKTGHSGTALSRNTLLTLAERSPTALVVTFALLSANRGKPLEEVFGTDLKAARFMIRHPDYLEGVRARVLDKDNRPRWSPSRIQGVEDPAEALFGEGPRPPA